MSFNAKLAVLTAASLMAVPGTGALASAATVPSAMHQQGDGGVHGHAVKASQPDVNIIVHGGLAVNGFFPKSVPAHRLQSSGPAGTGQGNPVKAGSQAPLIINGRPVLAEYHMIATGYGPSSRANYPYGPVDAFGKPLAPGMVAVDPTVIPLKSYVYVQGYHDSVLPSGGFLGRAMDTGGAIQGHRIDIFINAGPQTVSHFGIERVKVFVLGNPSS